MPKGLRRTTHAKQGSPSPKLTRRSFLALATSFGVGSGLASCASSSRGEVAATTQAETSDTAEQAQSVTTGLELDMGNWRYNEKDDVYYQLNVPYCADPVSELYETLGIFVPGAYFDAEEHGRVFSCAVNEDARIGVYTATNAPFFIPINVRDFAAQTAPSSYVEGSLADYLSQGIIYVYPGLRGRSSVYESSTDTFIPGGVPWGLVDAKAVVRFLRLNAQSLPGSCEHIATAGCGAGGALSVLLGATGDSELFQPYLDEIGAAIYDTAGNAISDAIYASASWCPIIPTDSANGAYEWMMGQYSSQDSRAEGSFTHQLSRDLAASWAEHLNSLGLTNSAQERLELNETQDAIYGAGSYYDYILSLVEDSFTAFVQQTEASVSVDTSTQRASTQSAAVFPGGATTDASLAEYSTEDVQQTNPQDYESVEAYLAALNTDYHWIDLNTLDSSVQIASLGAYVAHCRTPTQDVGAFDALDCSKSTNQLFGVDGIESMHYDIATCTLLNDNQDVYASLTNWDASYPAAYTSDIAELDSWGSDMQTRQNMYSPFYYLSNTYDGFGKVQVAQHWRIHTGMQQDATTLVQEANLVLCLEAYDGIESCTFTPVWDAGCIPCERSGSYAENLISWIANCCR